ncbi:hypothetical protein [Streptomyces sp. NPDC017949]|uniref:hypothetical protein n=1 Tax=Streptomyces sp. NPDC017949 TaxID=3365020 RepID=UPI003796B1DC
MAEGVPPEGAAVDGGAEFAGLVDGARCGVGLELGPPVPLGGVRYGRGCPEGVAEGDGTAPGWEDTDGRLGVGVGVGVGPGLGEVSSGGAAGGTGRGATGSGPSTR